MSADNVGASSGLPPPMCPPIDRDPSTAGVRRRPRPGADARGQEHRRARRSGEIVGKFGSLVLFAVMARELGDDGLGMFLFALAWGEVAMTPVGLGIDQYLLRAVAADRTRARRAVLRTRST